MEVLFEIDPIVTVEQLEQQERELLAQAETVRKAITEAKEKAKEENSHKLTEIVKNLHAEYGELFIEVVKKEIKFKPKKVVLSENDKQELKKFMHLFNRGYKGSEGKTYNHLGVEVKSNIPSQKTFIPNFSMSPKRFADWFETYNENQLG